FFANKVGRFMVVKSTTTAADTGRHYQVIGQVFFASSDKFSNSFDFREVVDKVTIDLSQAHFWDITAVSALDKVVIKFRREGTEVELIGLNEASATIVDKFGVHDKPEEVEKMMSGH
ncbi:TPA: SulP family inorganic anion transporter, partial [Salmonella enterica]|nr:SulP family inorganic anion transporter [Salmonella enterica]